MKRKLGQTQRALLNALSHGEVMTSREVAPLLGYVSTEYVCEAVRGLQQRGVLVEKSRVGAAQQVQNTYRLLPYPDKPWLPVEGIPIYVDIMMRGDVTEEEVRPIIEEHLACHARKKARAA